MSPNWEYILQHQDLISSYNTNLVPQTVSVEKGVDSGSTEIRSKILNVFHETLKLWIVKTRTKKFPFLMLSMVKKSLPLSAKLKGKWQRFLYSLLNFFKKKPSEEGLIQEIVLCSLLSGFWEDCTWRFVLWKWAQMTSQDDLRNRVHLLIPKVEVERYFSIACEHSKRAPLQNTSVGPNIINATSC